MIYTDKIHLIADSIEELHEFAHRIGLKHHYYHGVRKGHPHYDLINSTAITNAIENGAIVVSSRDIIEILKYKK